MDRNRGIRVTEEADKRWNQRTKVRENQSTVFYEHQILMIKEVDTGIKVLMKSKLTCQLCTNRKHTGISKKQWKKSHWSSHKHLPQNLISYKLIQELFQPQWSWGISISSWEGPEKVIWLHHPWPFVEIPHVSFRIIWGWRTTAILLLPSSDFPPELQPLGQMMIFIPCIYVCLAA